MKKISLFFLGLISCVFGASAWAMDGELDPLSCALKVREKIWREEYKGGKYDTQVLKDYMDYGLSGLCFSSVYEDEDPTADVPELKKSTVLFVQEGNFYAPVWRHFVHAFISKTEHLPNDFERLSIFLEQGIDANQAMGGVWLRSKGRYAMISCLESFALDAQGDQYSGDKERTMQALTFLVEQRNARVEPLSRELILQCNEKNGKEFVSCLEGVLRAQELNRRVKVMQHAPGNDGRVFCVNTSNH